MCDGSHPLQLIRGITPNRSAMFLHREFAISPLSSGRLSTSSVPISSGGHKFLTTYSPPPPPPQPHTPRVPHSSAGTELEEYIGPPFDAWDWGRYTIWMCSHWIFLWLTERRCGKEEEERRRVMDGGLARKIWYLGVWAMDSWVQIGWVVLGKLPEKCWFLWMLQPTSALVMPECEDGLLGCVTWCTFDWYTNPDGCGDIHYNWYVLEICYLPGCKLHDNKNRIMFL